MMDEIFDKLLKYGMFLGAIFQLVCIAAVIILPEQGKVQKDFSTFELSESDSDSNTHGYKRLHMHHRSRKQEKKKRR